MGAGVKRNSVLGRLSLGAKLLLAPAVGMICLLMVAGAAYYGLTQQQYTMSKISDVRFAHLQLAMETNTFLQEAQFGLARLFSTLQAVNDPVVIKASGDELLSKIQSAMPTLEFLSKQTELDPKEKEAIDATIEAVLKYGKAVEGALAAAEQHHSETGLNTGPDSAFELLSWNLATLVSIERKLTIEAFAESAQRSKQLSLVLASMLVLSFMAAFIVTVIVTRYIRGTVEAIRVAASELSRGNLTRRAAVPSDDEIGQTARAFNFLVDELARKEERLRKQALYDTLTGLPNRILLMDRLEHATVQAERKKHPIFVLFIDIDRFKLINDSLGHDIGDELLKTLAERMSSCIRKGDTLARLGGDEFVILLGNAFPDDGLEKLIQRILVAVAEPMMLRNQEITVTSSIGCSVYPDDGGDAITLLKHADTAMYRAKAEGRNNIQRYTSEMYIHVNERLVIETQLRHALERQEFLLYYQPQVDLQTGKVTGVEALIRWQHPDLGLVSPLRFIPIAEETRLIIPIGEWVVRTACKQAKVWQDAGFPTLQVAVNLSGQQLVRPELIGEVEGALRDANLSAKYLELELTETVSMSDPQRTVDLLQKLKGIGVSVAIDDFGTGYSNLAYLKQFPIQTLKLDRSFVCDVIRDSANRAIIQGIIGIARGLQLRVIAEGVEEKEQVSLLMSYGCDAMQGYYFSPPLPVEKCTTLLCEERVFFKLS